MGALRLVHSMPPFFYEKFAPEGTKIEIVVFDSPTHGKNAVVTRSVDFGTYGLAAATLPGAAGEPVVIIGAQCNRGMAVVAGAKSDIKSIKDLAGKNPASCPVPPRKSLSSTASTEGMSIKDIQPIRVLFSDMPAALEPRRHRRVRRRRAGPVFDQLGRRPDRRVSLQHADGGLTWSLPRTRRTSPKRRTGARLLKIHRKATDTCCNSPPSSTWRC